MADYPDFTVIARLKGEYAGAEKAVAVDVNGNLMTLLYGTYAGTQIPILVDVDGNVRMNLYAQDLDEVINRFKYGAPTFLYATGTMPLVGWNDVIDISGKGYIYNLDVSFDGGASHKTDNVRIYLDTEYFTNVYFQWLHDRNMYSQKDFWIALQQYDEALFRYRVSMLAGYTFESTIDFDYQRGVADNPSIARILTYSLI